MSFKQQEIGHFPPSNFQSPDNCIMMIKSRMKTEERRDDPNLNWGLILLGKKKIAAFRVSR